MKALIINDLILVRKSISWSYLFPLVVIAISSFGNVGFLLMVMPMVVLFLANSPVVNLFSREEASGWRVALRSFPVTGLEVAASRFLVAAALLAAAFAVMGVLVLVVAFAADVEFEGAYIGLVLGVWLILAYDSLLFPFLYRFGSSKANIATLTLVGTMIIAMYLLQRYGTTFEPVFSVPFPALVAGAYVLLAAIMVASVFISARVLSAEFPARDFLA